jgi:hypothetical protein
VLVSDTDSIWSVGVSKDLAQWDGVGKIGTLKEYWE